MKKLSTLFIAALISITTAVYSQTTAKPVQAEAKKSDLTLSKPQPVKPVKKVIDKKQKFSHVKPVEKKTEAAQAKPAEKK